MLSEDYNCAGWRKSELVCFPADTGLSKRPLPIGWTFGFSTDLIFLYHTMSGKKRIPDIHGVFCVCSVNEICLYFSLTSVTLPVTTNKSLCFYKS